MKELVFLTQICVCSVMLLVVSLILDGLLIKTCSFYIDLIACSLHTLLCVETMLRLLIHNYINRLLTILQIENWRILTHSWQLREKNTFSQKGSSISSWVLVTVFPRGVCDNFELPLIWKNKTRSCVSSSPLQYCKVNGLIWSLMPSADKICALHISATFRLSIVDDSVNNVPIEEK